jgi:transcriptional regulator with XRE-family HTH domain
MLLIGDAIKKFRQDCGQTQIEFAVALKMSATSIHRYEATTSVPDLESLKKLRDYAILMGNAWAERAFFMELVKKAGFDAANDPEAPQIVARMTPPLAPLELLEVQGKRLSKKERLWAICVVMLLRHSSDATAKNVLKTLFAPWFDEAIHEIFTQTGGSCDVSDVASEEMKSAENTKTEK